VRKVGPEPWNLEVVPVTGRGQVGPGGWMQADPRVLRARPALGQPRLDRDPFLGCDRPRASLAGALLDLRDPRLGGVRVGALVQAQQQPDAIWARCLAGRARALERRSAASGAMATSTAAMG
jgi:hypothetical protein